MQRNGNYRRPIVKKLTITAIRSIEYKRKYLFDLFEKHETSCKLNLYSFTKQLRHFFLFRIETYCRI